MQENHVSERQAAIRHQQCIEKSSCQCCFISILEETHHSAAVNRVSISMHVLIAVDPVSRLMSVKNSQSDRHTMRKLQTPSEMEKMVPPLLPRYRHGGLLDT